MGRQSLLPLVERVIAEPAAGYLQRLRDADLTYDDIARKLDADHQISVTGETVRQWCRRLDVKDAA